MKNFSDGFDGLMDDLTNQAVAGIEDEMAKDLAQRCREAGLTSANTAEIDIQHTPGSGDIRVDPERVRARANAILAAGRFKF